MARSKKPKQAAPVSMERRDFLRTGGLAGAAALVAPTELIGAHQPTVPPPSRPVAPPVMTMAAEDTVPADVEALTTDNSGSDFMVVDVIKSLGLDTYLRAPKGEMPPYTAKVMSDQDLADVYAFLRALPPAPPLSSLPLLQP